MDYVESYKDRVVYRTARQLSRDIFTLTKSFSKEEMYSLTDPALIIYK